LLRFDRGVQLGFGKAGARFRLGATGACLGLRGFCYSSVRLYPTLFEASIAFRPRDPGALEIGVSPGAICVLLIEPLLADECLAQRSIGFGIIGIKLDNMLVGGTGLCGKTTILCPSRELQPALNVSRIETPSTLVERRKRGSTFREPLDAAHRQRDLSRTDFDRYRGSGPLDDHAMKTTTVFQADLVGASACA
jgi:hypothetical protein